MANIDELKRLGERFPNENIGCGNPNAKILVVTQIEDHEISDFKYLRKMFEEMVNGPIDVLDYCYYTVFDEELLSDAFFKRFQIILYTFIDGAQLDKNNPAKIFDLEWTHYVFQDGDCQRLFVAHAKEQEDKPERIMLCTYPFERVTKEILSSSKVLFDYFLYTSTNFFEELRAKYEKN